TCPWSYPCRLRAFPSSTLPLHDALPISQASSKAAEEAATYDSTRNLGTLSSLDSASSGRNRETPTLCLHQVWSACGGEHARAEEDRKSTRLNSSHGSISYAVFCLKKTKL